MTEPEILAAARRAYGEMGVKPITGIFFKRDPHCACVFNAALIGIGLGPTQQIGEFVGTFQKPFWWIEGALQCWDGYSMSFCKSPDECAVDDKEQYAAGFAFGQSARREFLEGGV